MPAVVDRAVVLRLWEFSETSQTVSLFCREQGLLRGLAKGARRERGRFGGGFELLTLGEVVALVKPSTELATLTEWSLSEVFWSTRRDLRAHRIALYMIDLVHHAIVDHDPHPGLFDQLVSHLRTLDSPQAHAPSLLSFQWRLLVEIGYKPSLGTEEVGSSERQKTLQFDPLAGGITKAGGTATATTRPRLRIGTASGPAWPVRPQTINVLRRLDHADPTPFPDDGDPVHSERASRLLAEYLRVVLDRDLPTRRVLFGSGVRHRGSP